MTDQETLLVETERMRSVFQQAPLVLSVTLFNSVLTAAVLAPVASHRFLTVWLALIVSLTGVRWTIRQQVFRKALDQGRYRLVAVISVLGALSAGIIWGTLLVALFPASETYQLFIALVVGGMCAGTTSVHSTHMPTVLAFILPASLPLGCRFMVEGSTPHLASGIMILVFACALSVASWRTHRGFGEHLRLQLALSRQGRSLSEANDRLRDEVAVRLKTEATLHQAQKMEAIGHLTGGIAHDFNNLLHVVSGNLSMIARLADGNARILGYVRAAEQAARQGARLTNSLLAFARRQSLLVERVNANTLLQEFKPILLRAIDSKAPLLTSFAPDLPSFEADPAHFKSAILNVVINARDAMPAGGRLSISTDVITLRAEDLLTNPDANPGRFVSVSVQDTGSGMTAEVLSRVFEPFFTTKEVGKGSGLGLSQVYGFARQSGGHVQLHSEPGAGTRVTLCLPAVADR